MSLSSSSRRSTYASSEAPGSSACTEAVLGLAVTRRRYRTEGGGAEQKRQCQTHVEQATDASSRRFSENAGAVLDDEGVEHLLTCLASRQQYADLLLHLVGCLRLVLRHRLHPAARGDQHRLELARLTLERSRVGRRCANHHEHHERQQRKIHERHASAPRRRAPAPRRWSTPGREEPYVATFSMLGFHTFQTLPTRSGPGLSVG